MFEGMTVRWALVLFACVGAVLALVPFVAFFYGPQIRARSKISRLLMHEEREALESERYQREARGMAMAGVADLEGDANDNDLDKEGDFRA